MEWDAARFAIYFTPRPTNALAGFGRAWLGRDNRTAEPVPIERRRSIAVAGIAAARLAALTAEPALYGWHATLKPPFRLAPGQTPGALAAHIMAFAAARLPFEIPALELAVLDGFLALVPSAAPKLLQGLAEDCVRAFDGFRAPLEAEELARRHARGLTARQEALLRRWGYPYVMEEFRFHMTLTARLEEAEPQRLMAALERPLARLLRTPLAIDGVSLFAQLTAGAPFRELRRFPFEGA